MKNLDLKEMGVQEMNASEMKHMDGGFLWILELVVGYIIVEACINPQAHIKAWKEGWAAAN